jgi:surfeit locus 1 family protein
VTLSSNNFTHRASRFWWITALVVVSSVATLLLGRWQLSRAAQKEALQEHIVQQSQLTTLTSAVVTETVVDTLLDRTLLLEGTWLPQHTVYLDNRQMSNKQGFFVLTPLQLSGQRQVVMVQRGWVQRNFTDRESLPPFLTPTGLVQVTGRIARSPASLYELGPISAKGAPATKPLGPIRQNLSLAAYQLETQLPLWGSLLVQTDVVADGLQRNWVMPSTGVEKHYGYAFQWFGLSVLIVLLYVWFQLVPRSRFPQQAS